MGPTDPQYTSRAMRGLRRGPVGADAATGMTARAGGRSDRLRAADCFRGFRRLGILCRNSHTRRVSSETFTPSLASDFVKSRIDAPARRSVSSTSRNGSSSAKRREPRRRLSAISRASSLARSSLPAAAGSRSGERCGRGDSLTGGAEAVPGPTAGGGAVSSESRPGRSAVMFRLDSVGMVGIYPPPAGDAMGAPRATSKRRRLDVGVLPHDFIRSFSYAVGRLRRRRGFVLQLLSGDWPCSAGSAPFGKSVEQVSVESVARIECLIGQWSFRADSLEPFVATIGSAGGW
jgi:hypothetical protein